MSFFNTSDAWLVAFDLTTVIPEQEVILTLHHFPIPISDILFVHCNIR